MAIVSVRLNREEEDILEYLTDYYHEEKSSLLKKSMFEMYEDIQDIKFIEEYIEESNRKEKKFITSEELFT